MRGRKNTHSLQKQRDFISKVFGTEKEDDSEEKTMETKSRYEVIADLEKQKRGLIVEKDSFKDQLQEKEKEIKEAKRDIEDMEDDLKYFKDSIEDRKKTIETMIASIDDSLKRFEGVSKSQKK
jgi:predicted  nucleic acid-binding Zn-ribbon protein